MFHIVKTKFKLQITLPILQIKIIFKHQVSNIGIHSNNE